MAACIPNGGGSAESDAQQAAQAETSSILLALTLAYMVPVLLFMVPLGAHSDRAGRKWALIPPTLGELSRVTLNCLIVYFELPLWVFSIGAIIAGMGGSASLITSGAYAYIADVTTRESRAMRLTFTEVMVGVANTLGQLATGFFIDYFGFFLANVLLLVIMLTNLFYVVVLLGETNPRKDPGRSMPSLLSLDSITRPVKLYIKDNGTNRRWIMISVLSLCALNSFIVHGSAETTTLYFLNTPLCWGSVMIAIFNSYNWLVRGTAPIFWLALLRRHLTESGLIIMGVLSCIAYHIIMSQATQTWIVFLGMDTHAYSIIMMSLKRWSRLSALSDWWTLTDYRYPIAFQNWFYFIPAWNGLLFL